MRKSIVAILAIFTLCSLQEDHFKASQLQFSRVKTAYNEKETYLRKLVKDKKIDFEQLHIFIRAFKHEKELEIWGRSGATGKYTLIKTYSICRTSGELGPKKEQGDGQTPEGFYNIDRFNPASSFYLSLGINYPNQADRIRNSKNPGGDIFIHGDCVTIGCMPLTDDLIKEVYLLAIEAKDSGQTAIPVHIFPYRFNKELEVTASAELKEFWSNLRQGYDYFEKNLIPPKTSVLSSGKYQFSH